VGHLTTLHGGCCGPGALQGICSEYCLLSSDRGVGARTAITLLLSTVDEIQWHRRPVCLYLFDTRTFAALINGNVVKTLLGDSVQHIRWSLWWMAILLGRGCFLSMLFRNTGVCDGERVLNRALIT
jgi:hypothetical protein